MSTTYIGQLIVYPPSSLGNLEEQFIEDYSNSVFSHFSFNHPWLNYGNNTLGRAITIFEAKLLDHCGSSF